MNQDEISTVSLSELDLSNVKENIQNADRIIDTLWIKIKEFVAEEGLKLVLALLIVIIGFKLISLLIRAVSNSKWYKRIDPSMQTFLSSVIKIALKVLILMTAAGIMGIPMTTIIAAVTSSCLAIGLALQGSLSNIAGGFILAVTKPFVVGDWIRVNEYEGTVKEITILYTKVVTIDKRTVVIPNSVVSNQPLVDHDTEGTRRVEIDVGVSYDANIDDVRASLLRAVRGNENVIGEPKVYITSYDDSAVMYQLQFFVPSKAYLIQKLETTERVKRNFNEDGISIPYPQVDVHIKDDDSGRM